MLTKKHIEVDKCVYTVPVETRPEQKNLVMWVRVEDLPLDLKLDPNARRADTTSKVAKDIQNTLRESPDDFWKLNGGIQMTARDFEVKSGRTVVLSLHDPEDDTASFADGVINGGHTYECIKAVLDELTDDKVRLPPLKRAVVRVEVLTGLDRDELPDISRARNTGAQVKKFSLQNLKRLYDPIKKELGPEECERIGFCENDVDVDPTKNFEVIELIRLMSLFNNGLYHWDKQQDPVVCYTSAGRLVDKWEKYADTYEPLIPKLRTLMQLHDLVYIRIAEWAGRQKGRARNGIDSQEQPLPFTRRMAPKKVSNAFVYPVVSGLRVLLGPDHRWKLDPIEYLDAAGDRMIEVLLRFYDSQCRSKPYVCGRSDEAWRSVVAEARASMAEELLRRASTRS
jgi:hypothetical protein